MGRKRGEHRPYRFSWVGCYSATPGYKDTFCGACVEARTVARVAASRGHDDACIVTDRTTGRTWTIHADTDIVALGEQ